MSDENIGVLIEQLLRECGMQKSGDYDPARATGDGRYSIDEITLLLLLTEYKCSMDERREVLRELAAE